jgi:ZIP family zinc transporter
LASNYLGFHSRLKTSSLCEVRIIVSMATIADEVRLLALPYRELFVIITFFSTMVGGIFTLRKAVLNIKPFFAFAAGALIGICFFDLLPESVSISVDNGIELNWLMVVIVVAFLFFHLLDRFLILHAMGEGHADHGLRTSGKIKASGLSIHSFLDGVAIGAAFHVGFQLGLVVALAVVFHDFSDGLNTVTVMMRSGSSRRAAFGWLLLDSITPLVGATITYLIPIPIYLVGFMLSFFVGEFLYLGAADLLPEAHREGSSAKLVLATIGGVLAIFATTQILKI